MGKKHIPDDIVIKIYYSKKPVPEIVKLYGASESTVRRIRDGRSRKEVIEAYMTGGKRGHNWVPGHVDDLSVVDYGKFDNDIRYRKKELQKIANGLGCKYITEAYAKLASENTHYMDIGKVFNVSGYTVRKYLILMGIPYPVKAIGGSVRRKAKDGKARNVKECLRCGLKFRSTDKNWAVCKKCVIQNQKTSDISNYKCGVHIS